MKRSDSKKVEQLGMPFGTACHRLRKAIMFRLVQETKKDICVRCGQAISTVDELSIEHLKNWLDVDPSLFWNLDNIGFSHSRCNITDRHGRPNVKIGATGTAWCTGHQEFVAVEKFAPCRTHFNGLQWECKECRSKRQKVNPWRKVNLKKNGALPVA